MIPGPLASVRLHCRNRQETRMVTSGDFLLSVSWHDGVRVRVGAAGRARDAGNSLDWPVNLKPARASRQRQPLFCETASPYLSVCLSVCLFLFAPVVTVPQSVCMCACCSW